MDERPLLLSLSLSLSLFRLHTSVTNLLIVPGGVLIEIREGGNVHVEIKEKNLLDTCVKSVRGNLRRWRK